MSEAAGSAGGAAPAGDSGAGTTEGGASPVQGGVAAQPTTQAELRELGAQDMDAVVTMKVDGQAVRMSVKEALKLAELGGGAQRRMKEAAATRKEMEKLLESEEEYFKRRGIDPDQYAEKRLVAKYEKLAMTPEQKKQWEMEQELNQYKSAESQTKEGLFSQLKNLIGDVPPEMRNLPKEQLQQEVMRAEHLINQERQTLEKEFVDAWSATGLPKLPIFGQWTASLMHASQVQKNAGQREEALQAREAADIVKENFLRSVKDIAQQMGPEGIHQLFGPDIMKALRAFDVQRVTAKAAPSFEQSNRPAKTASGKKDSNVVNENGWKARFENL